MFVTFIIAFTLIGCNNTSVTDQMYEHLEKSVELEKDNEKLQQDIITLEKKEQAIYDQVRDLSMDQFDEIKSLSNDALEIISERQEKLEQEKEHIESSKEEFVKNKALIEKIEDEEVKKSARKMYDQMIERYDTYEQLYETYENTLELEAELYEKIQSEEMSHEQISIHIEEVNDSYDQVLKLNDQFNEATREYNNLKMIFYQDADMNVSLEKD